MKIQTQAGLLVAGIIAVPILIILTVAIYRLFLSDDVVHNVPAYNEISAMLEEHINPRDWDSLARGIARSSNIGDVVIFRDDFLVLYSEIPEFSQGVLTSWEKILPLLENQRFIFNSIGLQENQGYILINLRGHSFKEGLVRFFTPALIGMFFLGILIIFAICMSIIITRTITHSVKVLENATLRIAEGELDFKVEAKGNNEIISLTNSLNKMRDTLKEDELRRSRLIMGITHDLKTPLALIKGYAEAIEDGITENPFSRSGSAEIIIEKADQLEGMINDLINYVHLETGEWRSRLDDVNLTFFLQNLAKNFYNDVELLQHTLIHDINLPDNVSVPLDERLVLRAFENLIHNAVRYSPHGSIIHLAAVKHGNTVEIKISDNGPGLDNNDISHIFEIFYRGSSSRREQGIGLGLTVVKWVVDYHGWSIQVSSEKGKGTCFVITIPLPVNISQGTKA